MSLSICKDKIQRSYIGNTELRLSPHRSIPKPVAVAQAALQKFAIVKLTGILNVAQDVVFRVIKPMLNFQDQLVLACACKQFNVLFKNTAQLLLDSVKDCKTLTSMKTLRKHVEDLNKYWPEYLGAGKQWTIPRVIYFYSLKTVDFSEEGLSTKDAVILLSAFADIMQNEAPLRTVEMGRQAGEFSIASIIYRISPEQRIQVSKLADISVENISSEDLSYAICELPRIQAAEIFRSVLGNIYREWTFIREPYTQKVFGNIETFKIGLDQEPFGWDLSQKSFFNAFCPRLKVLVMPFIEGISQSVRTFFSTESRRNVLTHFEIAPLSVVDSEFSWDFYELFLSQANLVQTGPRFGIMGIKDLVRVAKACPQLSQLCLNMDKIKNTGTERIQNALQIVAVYCPNITSLSINTLPADLDKKLLVDLAQKFPKLKELHIVSRSQESYEVILSFLEHCPKLSKLHLEFMSNVYNSFDFNRELLRICPFQPHLEYLNINMTSVAARVRTLTSRTIYDLSRQLPNLFSFLTSRNFCDVPSNHTSDIWGLRAVNKKMEKKYYSNKDISNLFKRLTVVSYRQNFIALYLNGLVADLSSAKKLFEEDVGLLKKCDRRPVFSIQGNIIEQQLQRAILIAQRELIEMDKNLMEPSDYAFKIMSLDNAELKMHLQVFEIMLKELSCPQELLLYYYSSFFTPANRRALANLLADLISNSPNSVHSLIKSDIRCLIPAVKEKLAMLED